GARIRGKLALSEQRAQCCRERRIDQYRMLRAQGVQQVPLGLPAVQVARDDNRSTLREIGETRAGRYVGETDDPCRSHPRAQRALPAAQHGRGQRYGRLPERRGVDGGSATTLTLPRAF